MTPLRLLRLDGDGIGPEIMAATVSVLDAVRDRMTRPVDIVSTEIGFAALERHDTTMPDSVIEAARSVDGVLLGPVSHNAYPPREEGGLNPSGELRRRLDLFANIRPARSWDGLPAACGKALDLIVVRENLEGFYADRNMHVGPGEFMPVPGMALSIRRITEAASRRIAETAFRLASRRPAAKVAAVHKANVLRVSDGLFLETVRDVASRYPEIAYEEVLVDAAAAHLVRDPDRFDVIVTTNMFGDILSDLAAELAGGLGLAGSLNLGPEAAAAQAQHGSAPDIAGTGSANPVSLILSLQMLLDHLGESTAANAIGSAVAICLADKSTRTPDLGGMLTTKAFTEVLRDQIARMQ
ncbi:MAG: isocitrate/isopropylmalate dehydrogenase family protein [Pseudomonadota bacterium]